MKPTNLTPTAPSSSFTSTHTPPDSPRLEPVPSTIFLGQMKTLLVEAIQEARALPAPVSTTKPEATLGVQSEAPNAQASILEFKEVNEVFVPS